MRCVLVVLAALVAGCSVHKEAFSDAAPSLHVGQVALDSGEPAIALSVADTALLATPSDANALLLRADAEMVLGRMDQAVADYGRVLDLRPGSAGAALGMARAITPTDPRRAEALLGGLVAHGTATAAIWNNLGVAHDLLGRHAEAQDAYRRALVLDPVMQAAQVNLARSLAMTLPRQS